MASAAFAADILPAPEPSQPPPRGQSPAEPSRPNIEPGPTDPGMVKQPETVPHPDSVVTPPVVDPKMAINPETGTPPAVEEPSERSNQDPAPKKP